LQGKRNSNNEKKTLLRGKPSRKKPTWKGTAALIAQKELSNQTDPARKKEKEFIPGGRGPNKDHTRVKKPHDGSGVQNITQPQRVRSNEEKREISEFRKG